MDNVIPVKQRRTRRKTNYKNAEQKNTSGLLPRTGKQKLFIDALKENSQVFVLGPAGTGKTYVTATFAADLYITKKIDKIVITRPHVAVGKDLGYLPGSLEEKTYPWALPVLDVLEKHLGKGSVDTGVKNGNIEMAPLALMRGRSFDNSFIIVDETQNITTHELKMLLTRVGENSTIVLNGDVQQSDLKEADGLSKVIHLAKKYMLPVPIIEFGVDDIVRSDICAEWVKVFMKENL
ncbi:MAG: phosphate starvation-inducible protein PhoH [Phycisphaerae bacterium]|nr:phosphate starvation-inducible protein PhoH [Phycisphaerae bacterium]|tara:strand:+ start:530 stop:1237 length:708 start_codon:yes stop_codon:yes gene_type:complete